MTMRLIKLDICNFRVLRNVHLEFPDALIGIIGQNGSGKSSIVEAIAWALYGNQVARSGKDEIKSSFAGGAENCEVSLEFEINRQPYRVVRRLSGRRERPEVELYRGGVSASVGSTETRAYVEQLLGLDWRGFLTSFLARQQELNALSDLMPSKRREHLAGMLGIERLDRAIQRIREDVRVSSEKGEYIEQQLAQKEPLEVDITRLREHIDLLERQQDMQSGACNRTKLRLDELTAAYREHEAGKSACSQLSARIEAQQTTADNLREQIGNSSAEVADLENAQRELNDLERELQEFESFKNQFEKLMEIKSRAAHRTAISEQIESAKVDKEGLEQRQKVNRELLDRSATELGKIPENIEQLHKSGRENLDAARAEWSHLQAGIEATERELAKLKDQILSIAEIGPDTVCDRCHRPFGDDLPAIKAHLDREHRELMGRLQTFKEQIPAKQANGEKLREEVAKLEQQCKRKFELETQLEATLKEEQDLTQRLDNTSKQLDKLAAQLKELGEFEFDRAEYERVATRVTELEKLNERRNQITGSLRRLEPARRELQRSEEKLSRLTMEMEKLKQEQREIGFDESEFKRVASDLSAVQQHFEKEKEAVASTVKELELARREHDLKGEQLDGLKKAAEELEALRTDRYHGERLSRLFADFRMYLIARIRPRLSELASELLSEMTAGKYGLVELDEDYNLRILDYSQFFGVDRFSGGEKDLANLCLRLAISLALSESAGLERSFVILDEVFGSQDDERRDLIFKGLVGLKNRFPQVFLITHVEEIRDRVEYLVEVRPSEAGWSEVRVSGSVV